MINPAALMKLKKLKDVFIQNHPKLPSYFKAVSNAGIEEGTVIEIKVTKPNLEPMVTNILVKDSDVEMFDEVAKMFK